jgi:parallel beta-helix repeat protein
MSANKVIVANASALVAAVSAAATNDTTCIEIALTSDDSLTLTTTLVIPPDFFNTASKRLIIEGNGATIKCPAGGFGINTALISRKSVSDNKACSLIFRNINFDCGGNQMICLELYNASNVIIENCRFNNCKRGLVLKRIDTATVDNCVVNNATEYGFYCGISEIFPLPDPTLLSKSNNIVFNNCKVVGSSQLQSGCVAWSLNDVQTIELNNIQLYGNVLTGVEYIISNTTVFSNFKINNITIGSLVSTGVKLVMNSGFAQIDGVYITVTIGGFVIDASSLILPANSTLPHLYVRNIPVLPAGAKFRTTGGVRANSPCDIPQPSNVVVWEFYEVADGDNIWSAARWDDPLFPGFIPYYRYAEFFSESKTILTNSMTVNSKPL